MYKCSLCEGTGLAEYWDIPACAESKCNKALKKGEECTVKDCKIFNKVGICPDCNGLGTTITDNSTIQNKSESVKILSQ